MNARNRCSRFFPYRTRMHPRPLPLCALEHSRWRSNVRGKALGPTTARTTYFVSGAELGSSPVGRQGAPSLSRPARKAPRQVVLDARFYVSSKARTIRQSDMSCQA